MKAERVGPTYIYLTWQVNILQLDFLTLKFNGDNSSNYGC